MTKEPKSIPPTAIVESNTMITLDELCEVCQVQADWITELVEHGAIDPIEPVQSEWHFTSVTVVRVAKAKRLWRDLNLNTPGVALALDLLDEIQELRANLKTHGAPGRADR